MGTLSRTNLLKGFAILAVVAIHVINVFIGRNLWLTNWDQVLRFSVPLFTALSGLALAKKYAAGLKLKEFYSRRLLKLLPLYALWSAVYWLVTRQPFPFAYHLYFVPMIFQAYLIFPFILPIIKKLPWVALIISGVLQVLYFQHHNTPTNDQYQYLWFAAWQFYFVLGIFLAFVSSSRIRLIGLIAAAAGLVWSIRDTQALLETGKNLIWATRFTRIPVIVYSGGLTIALVNWAKKSRVLTFLGANSYLIYLSHILFLKLLLAPDFVLSVPIVVVIGAGALVISLLI